MKRLILFSFSFAMAGFLTAQDFHLSQYDAAKQYLNPSLTGLFSGHYRITANYRSQWAVLATKPFTTGAIAFDMPVRKFGFGVQVMNNRAGAGDFNVTGGNLSVSYDLAMGSKKFHHVAIGAQGGFLQKNFDPDKLVFDSQYSTANGGTFDNTISNGESFGKTSIFLPDVSAGMTYFFSKDDALLNPHVGFSAFHLTQPQETFFGYDNKLPVRYYLHGGVKVNLSETVQLQPRFIQMMQTNAREFTTSLILNYYLKNADAHILFGPTWRNSDAAIIETGLQLGKFTYRISYDFNTSSLKPVTTGRGGIEFSIVYVAKKHKPKPISNCPRL